MLASHYAPSLPVRLDATSVASGEALLAFGPDAPRGGAETRWLSKTGEVTEAAANLFAMLRALDRPEFSAIAVMPIPKAGLGRAINDRLRRAAARSQQRRCSSFRPKVAFLGGLLGAASRTRGRPMTFEAANLGDTLDQLKQVVGEKGYIAEPAAMAPYLVEERGMYRGAAQAVRPPILDRRGGRDRAAVRWRRPADLSPRRQYRPRGGAVPWEDGYGIVLSLGRMNRVRASIRSTIRSRSRPAASSPMSSRRPPPPTGCFP